MTQRTAAKLCSAIVLQDAQICTFGPVGPTSRSSHAAFHFGFIILGPLGLIGKYPYATHINYFGDSVLFVGWAMLSASIIGWSIPIFVTAGFVFFHIPALDTYLSKRYGAEFDDYASKTAKLIRFIY